MAKLTDLKVRNIKPTDKRQTLSDNGSGLYLIVQPSGYKSYASFPRVNGKQIKIVHGEAGVLSLHDARAASAEAIRQAKLGNDPNEAKRAAKQKEQIAEANTFAAIALKYLDSDSADIRTIGDVRHRLRLVSSLIGDKPVADIRRSDIVKTLDRIARTNGKTQANRTLSAIRCVLHFYGDLDDDYRPPLLSKLSRKVAARDRVLDDAEIRAVWNAGNSFANFLLCTSARRNEAAAMQWREIVGADWILPAARNQKTKRDLVRPLSKEAMALLPQRGADDEYVFGHTPDKPLRSYARLKRRLDAASGVSNFRLHDLRRTARTLMSRAGVNPDHAERCLGHIVGGVRGIYDRWEFHDEKALAFEALVHQIKLITDPPAGNVTTLNRKRA